MPARAIVIGSKAIIYDREEGNKLFKKFFGKPFASSKPKPDRDYDPPFVLSLYEALYLCQKGELVPVIEGRESSCSDLEDYAKRVVPRFEERYAVYRDLRDRGYIVRSGMKFGTDFAVYEIGPGYEHAPYVVRVVRRGDVLDSVEIVLMGRLSHSVRKRSVLAVVDVERSVVNYLVFKWVRM
ncbi:MAG: tRNA-intron lyase [Crenarchaeota archaeon]|nr:tRNA-intron lyase [Thermoproteota archaeon]